MPEVITAHELNQELLRVSKELDSALETLSQTGYDLARAEYEYRMDKAKAYALVRESNVTLLAAERDALADSYCAATRRKRDEADYMRQAYYQKVRAMQQQLSALQSVAASARGQMELDARGPN